MAGLTLISPLSSGMLRVSIRASSSNVTGHYKTKRARPSVSVSIASLSYTNTTSRRESRNPTKGKIDKVIHLLLSNKL